MGNVNGYCTIQVKDIIRDFVKFKQAKAVTKGKKLTVSDVILKALEETYSKEMKQFCKFRDEE